MVVVIFTVTPPGDDGGMRKHTRKARQFPRRHTISDRGIDYAAMRDVIRLEAEMRARFPR
jgi:hypothetical protein